MQSNEELIYQYEVLISLDQNISVFNYITVSPKNTATKTLTTSSTASSLDISNASYPNIVSSYLMRVWREGGDIDTADGAGGV